MNIALRKLAMIEQEMIRREESARLDGFTYPIDHALKDRITKLMDKVRTI